MQTIFNPGFQALCLLAGWALCGCGGGAAGDGNGPPAKAGTPNRFGALTVIANTRGMKTALDAGDGASLASNLELAAITGPQLIVQPVAPGGVAKSQLIVAGSAGGTVTCTAAACVYNNYTPVAGVVFNGRVTSVPTSVGTRVTADLTFNQYAAALKITGLGSADYQVTGTLDFTPTTIDGDLKAVAHASASYAGLNLNYEYYNEIRYTALSLTGTNPTAGSIYAKWAVSVAGAPYGNQAYEATLTFP
jgi:hypothetical protein